MAKRMLVLSIDTATPAPAVALCGGDDDREVRLPAGRSVSEEILAAIARLVPPADLPRVDRFAVAAGPGSFTGIRVGLSTAWGLARAVGRDLETVDSLEACAETARGAIDTVWAYLPSERGEVYAGRYDLTGARAVATVAPTAMSAEEFARRVGSDRAVSAPETGSTAALAIARACRRSPGETTIRPEARYVQPAAAEERFGDPAS